MTRFDASIFPTIEEILADCQRNPHAPVGYCQLPGQCVIAQEIAKRLPDAVRVRVYPTYVRVAGFALLQWPNTGHWVGVEDQIIDLPDELNTLACKFDALHLQGSPAFAHEVIPLCEQIIAERSAT